MERSIALRLADGAAASGIVRLRDSLALWQQGHDIEQWSPGEVTVGQVSEQIAKHEWWIGSDSQEVLMAFRLTEQDELVWPDDQTASTYIHGLMLDRSLSGQAIGRQLLNFAEEKIRLRDKTWAKLDCVASNHALRRFYEDNGYQERGLVEFGNGVLWHPVMRYEKKL